MIGPYSIRLTLRGIKTDLSVAKITIGWSGEALEILNPGGTLILSTNAANVTKEKFKKTNRKGFQGRKHRYVAESAFRRFSMEQGKKKVVIKSIYD